jgi:hypothetical protein
MMTGFQVYTTQSFSLLNMYVDVFGRYEHSSLAQKHFRLALLIRYSDKIALQDNDQAIERVIIH